VLPLQVVLHVAEAPGAALRLRAPTAHIDGAVVADDDVREAW
jgi:hypothetical protein